MRRSLGFFVVAFVLGAALGACLNPVTRGVEADAGCNCTGAADCARGQGCVACHCGECTRSNQCAPGQVCVDATCRGCNSTLECSPPSECITALCTSLCTSDDECAAMSLVCNLDAGVCVACGPNAPCPNSKACVGGFCQACANNNQCGAGVCNADGGCSPCGAAAACDGGLVCRADGGCGLCLTGLDCAPGQGCIAGRCGDCTTGADCPTPLACSSGVCGACTAPNAQCPLNRICQPDGGCGACVTGAACLNNPSPCFEGTAQCIGSNQSCRDSVTPHLAGVDCPGGVCDGIGNCVPCVRANACSNNPNGCKRGSITCGTGGPICSDTTVNADAGVACGTNQVCDGLGNCTICVAGVPCSTNPNRCRNGLTSCATGSSTCADGPSSVDAGTPCGVGSVCAPGGTCNSCDAGDPCSGNTTTCLRGVIGCASGSPTCVDGTVAVDAGVSCGASLLCTGAGTCGLCVADAGCTTNPDPCRQGTQSCGAFPVVDCFNTAALRDAGTPCGTNKVCNPAGGCAQCDAGVTCATNPGPCKVGITTCATGNLACVDSAANKPPGTACPIGVCTVAGACAPCDGGVGCTGNPNVCKVGIVSCASGSAQCVNSTVNMPNGTLCPSSTCTAGQCCTPNWVDTSGCGCSASCESSCNGQKSQSDGCGNMRTVACTETNTECCPCAASCRWQGGNCDGYCPLPRRHYQEYCPQPCACGSFQYTGNDNCQNTDPCF